MESREIVPNNLFAGQQWRKRHREQTYGHAERGRVVREFGIDMHTLLCLKRITNKDLL